MFSVIGLLTSHLLIVIGVLAVATAIILVLNQRRSSQAAIAWLMFIVALPYVAVPVFLVLGFRKTDKHTRQLDFSPAPDGTDTFPPVSLAFTALGAPPPTLENALELHTTPEAGRAALSGVIGAARHRIDIELYVLSHDDSGLAFVELLTQKARDGVEVRMAGKALGDAGEGERVSVENLSSRRVMQGVATPGGDVLVSR